LHSAFWLEHRLWGDATLGYHLVNIAWHALAAILVAMILRRLAIPGAHLAAAVFALHPVCVESVAWITEQKNTLSAVFYLGAALLYVHFDLSRRKRFYFLALGLFGAALLCKTVTATLPGALLVIFWWQRGRLSWRRDVLPLAPFFALGAAAGVFTAWIERTMIGAEGARFAISAPERFLIAGRAVWFYLGKLVWPADLLFIYPRWHLDATAWGQYLYPAAALLWAAALWALRRRWRGPLAGSLYFAGTLFPALGFFNVYPFLFSFVADHFQYLATLGIITVASSGAALLLARCRSRQRLIGYGVCLALVATLGALTWRQSRMYNNLEALL
jgi:protein O-mannosyl-transferase